MRWGGVQLAFNFRLREISLASSAEKELHESAKLKFMTH
jgi:hypothetical protein